MRLRACALRILRRRPTADQRRALEAIERGILAAGGGGGQEGVGRGAQGDPHDLADLARELREHRPGMDERAAAALDARVAAGFPAPPAAPRRARRAIPFRALAAAGALGAVAVALATTFAGILDRSAPHRAPAVGGPLQPSEGDPPPMARTGARPSARVVVTVAAARLRRASARAERLGTVRFGGLLTGRELARDARGRVARERLEFVLDADRVAPAADMMARLGRSTVRLGRRPDTASPLAGARGRVERAQARVRRLRRRLDRATDPGEARSARRDLAFARLAVADAGALLAEMERRAPVAMMAVTLARASADGERVRPQRRPAARTGP